MAVALPQRGVRAAALTHLLCVVRLLWLDARAPPFTALLSSPPRWLVLPHTTHTAALNATLSALSRLDGAARLHVLVSQQLPRSAAPCAASTAQLLRSAPRFPFEWTHRVHFVESDREKAGLARVAQALEDVFGGEGAAEGGAIVIDGGVEVAADLLEFFAFGASLVEATRALPAAERVALVGSVCPHTSQPYRSLAGDSLVPFSPSRYHRLRPVEVAAAWLATKQIYTAMREDARSALAHNTTIPLEPAAYLQWRWGGSRLMCPEVPRAYRLLEEDTIANSDANTPLRYAMAVYSWQYVDGVYRRAGRWLANMWILWLVFLFWRLSIRMIPSHGRRVAPVYYRHGQSGSTVAHKSITE